ncbi:MAG TPA: hypothetical protein VGK29_08830 [Paludibaculum sp.]|jgi:hypothetical protein
MRRLVIGLLVSVVAARGQAAEDLSGQLLGLKRVFIDKFGGGEGSAQLRDMVIASMQRARLFVVTENADRADAVLRGSGEDLAFTDVFQSGESVGARANVSGGKGTSVKNRDYLALGSGVNESESTRIQERKHEAAASVRLVNKEGDVIWSTTQESVGAKLRSASADVAEKITRQLVQDYERARGRRGQGGGGAAAVEVGPAVVPGKGQ